MVNQGLIKHIYLYIGIHKKCLSMFLTFSDIKQKSNIDIWLFDNIKKKCQVEGLEKIYKYKTWDFCKTKYKFLSEQIWQDLQYSSRIGIFLESELWNPPRPPPLLKKSTWNFPILRVQFYPKNCFIFNRAGRVMLG